MTSAPYIRLYVVDYTADTGHLTAEEHGCYFMVLMALHRADGALMGDEDRLRCHAKASEAEWARCRAAILDFLHHRHGHWVLRSRFVCHVEQREGRSYNPEWIALRAAVLERDKETCRYCGDTDGPFEADHVHPVSKGGKDTLATLVCACRPCNRSKGAKLVEEWMP